MNAETLTVGDIQDFDIAVPEADLADLKSRLARTRWPEKETVDDWSQGAPLSDVQQLCAYWASDYDWRRVEKELNSIGAFTAKIGGLDQFFLHKRSKHAQATPMIMFHGWPGSVVEFLDALPKLTDPTAHGGTEADAFHVVIPALAGYGFSGKPATTGWGLEKIADAGAALMQALGYERYLVQGGDWGSEIAMQLAHRHQGPCLGAHLNMVACPPPKEVLEAPTAEEVLLLKRLAEHQKSGRGYMIQQATKPQTLGYGLTDSPAGQAAWIYEKFSGWSEAEGRPENGFSRDRLLDNISLYWLTASATSSARLYWESTHGSGTTKTSAPVACSIFPHEIFKPSRRWAESRYTSIRYWNETEKGGHFAAMEQPKIFVDEVRGAAKALLE